jgi:hypothetical protein
LDTKEKKVSTASTADKKKFAIEKVESAISNIKDRPGRGPYFINDRKKQNRDGS